MWLGLMFRLFGDMSEILSDADCKLVDDVRDKLLEQFDVVVVMVQRHSGSAENTAAYNACGGNFYAQLGQVREWLSIQDQYQRNHAIRQDRKK